MDLINAIQFDSWAEFIDMGGYAFNVWAVYGLFALFIAVNILVPLRRRSALLRDLRRRGRIEDQVALNSAATPGVQTAKAESRGQLDETGEKASQPAGDTRRPQQGDNS
ncbi:MAG: heme exporter protein CcmD [Proteobacteria bacterium]|jgi:heme exporter protein D|nr:heme exporter protein CcmD [Pseudomonadota bacterium]MDA0895243.1 heme exporter protein CcmD [Pseudomonadota bacterium]MDA1243660.1 heme exporter protein CcmD [Pseudomonadota bacterium]